jgi:RNA polymerase sigma factor (TIGR02999 family)
MDREDLQGRDREENEVTRILQRTRDCEALSEADQARLLNLTYAELRRLAASFMSRERAEHTLQPTALVHQAWLRMTNQRQLGGHGRAQFMAIASQAMRRVLVDAARARGRDKRGGGRAAVNLEPEQLAMEAVDVDLVALDEALQNLQAHSVQQARLVELRFFGGLTMPEVAAVMEMPLRTAEREWRFARLWLLNALQDGPR